jgi:hypothetical protein
VHLRLHHSIHVDQTFSFAVVPFEQIQQNCSIQKSEVRVNLEKNKIQNYKANYQPEQIVNSPDRRRIQLRINKRLVNSQPIQSNSDRVNREPIQVSFKQFFASFEMQFGRRFPKVPIQQQIL